MQAKLFTDGAARGNPGPSACSCFLFDEKNMLISFNGKFLQTGTNNQAEYQGLILGLKLAIKNNITDLTCYLDSELVVKQLNGEYKIKDEQIKKYAGSIADLKESFSNISFKHIARAENKHADKLANLILDASGN